MLDHPVRVHERERREAKGLVFRSGEFEDASLFGRTRARYEVEPPLSPAEESAEELEERGRVVVAAEDDRRSNGGELLEGFDTAVEQVVCGARAVENVARMTD
jgi:hypothetical protein